MKDINFKNIILLIIILFSFVLIYFTSMFTSSNNTKLFNVSNGSEMLYALGEQNHDQKEIILTNDIYLDDKTLASETVIIGSQITIIGNNYSIYNMSSDNSYNLYFKNTEKLTISGFSSTTLNPFLRTTNFSGNSLVVQNVTIEKSIIKNQTYHVNSNSFGFLIGGLTYNDNNFNGTNNSTFVFSNINISNNIIANNTIIIDSLNKEISTSEVSFGMIGGIEIISNLSNPNKINFLFNDIFICDNQFINNSFYFDDGVPQYFSYGNLLGNLNLYQQQSKQSLTQISLSVKNILIYNNLIIFNDKSNIFSYSDLISNPRNKSNSNYDDLNNSFSITLMEQVYIFRNLILLNKQDSNNSNYPISLMGMENMNLFNFEIDSTSNLFTDSSKKISLFYVGPNYQTRSNSFDYVNISNNKILQENSRSNLYFNSVLFLSPENKQILDIMSSFLEKNLGSFGYSISIVNYQGFDLIQHLMLPNGYNQIYVNEANIIKNRNNTLQKIELNFDFVLGLQYFWKDQLFSNIKYKDVDNVELSNVSLWGEKEVNSKVEGVEIASSSESYEQNNNNYSFSLKSTNNQIDNQKWNDFYICLDIKINDQKVSTKIKLNKKVVNDVSFTTQINDTKIFMYSIISILILIIISILFLISIAIYQIKNRPLI